MSERTEYEKKWGTGPHYTADALVSWKERYVLLIQRKDFTWALPGGFVERVKLPLSSDHFERPLDTARREVREETGIDLYGHAPNNIRIYDSRDRDPRSWMITTVYRFHLFGEQPIPKHGDDAVDAAWVNYSDIPAYEPLFADHSKIIKEMLR